MKPLTFEEAYAVTDPNDSEEGRNAAATRLLEGAAANRQYWAHRSELEALRAEADGHGVVSRGENEGEHPTGVAASTAAGTVAPGSESETAVSTAEPPSPAVSAGVTRTEDVPPDAAADRPAHYDTQQREG